MIGTWDRNLLVSRILGILSILLLWNQSTNGTTMSAQTQDEEKPFTLRMGVNEVSLAFHVLDSRGNSIDDLPLSSFQLWDGGTEEHRISGFRFYRDLPVRAGFLFDASGSMEQDLEFNEYVANLYATRMLRVGKDRAFVMDFGVKVRLDQDWTDDPKAIAKAIRAIPPQSSTVRPQQFLTPSTPSAKTGGLQTGKILLETLSFSLRMEWMTQATPGLEMRSICAKGRERLFTSSRINGI